MRDDREPLSGTTLASVVWSSAVWLSRWLWSPLLRVPGLMVSGFTSLMLKWNDSGAIELGTFTISTWSIALLPLLVQARLTSPRLTPPGRSTAPGKLVRKDEFYDILRSLEGGKHELLAADDRSGLANEYVWAGPCLLCSTTRRFNPLANPWPTRRTIDSPIRPYRQSGPAICLQRPSKPNLGRSRLFMQCILPLVPTYSIS